METWKSIEGYSDIYEISDYGNVRSIDRTYYDSNGFLHKLKGRTLKPTINKYGYLQVGLSLNSKIKSFTVHTLVAKAFILNPDNKLTVNHKDGNKLNNKKDNLEWATKSEQAIHALNNGLRTMPNVWKGKYGSKHGASKRVVQCTFTGNKIKEYDSIIEAANENKINPSLISGVCNGNKKTSGGFKWKFVN
jgi:hypothetical protein